ncbi:unnamed protein product [Rotaria socialis]|uniref:Uncharacterized protein n=1 Tax=Rotaria socialis TaxID=392032 RepID=A0A821J9D8_9BILA|nr:unnamed protein product [Rotaria socialis]
MKEAEFLFDSLSVHMNLLKTNIAVATADLSPLNDGIPTNLHYKIDFFFTKLREWFSSENRSHLINIHMIQPITNMQIVPNPFLLSTFGTNNTYEVHIVGVSTDGDPKYMRATYIVRKKGLLEAMNIYLSGSQTNEGIFRSARSMFGTFYWFVNFSVQEFLNRTQKLSLLERFKTEIEFYSANGNILFPKHYKQRKQLRQSQYVIPGNYILNVETITKVIFQAKNDAADLLFRFKIQNCLDTKKIRNIKAVNNCMKNSLIKRISIRDYSDLKEEDESSVSKNDLDEMLGSESDVDREDQQYETSNILSDGIYDDLDGIKFSDMRVFDKVRFELEKSYFELKINRKKKMYKQTNCLLDFNGKQIGLVKRSSGSFDCGKYAPPVSYTEACATQGFHSGHKAINIGSCGQKRVKIYGVWDGTVIETCNGAKDKD